ncbi:hypothetical protein FA95DRAFT_1577410 [Auriscalpium vulgare]|uniref:Uncharacterized protein n=1 Tax=Auriscalpium vulgare TaxID=40419 RepID=A0ACB8R736_9AGAM|nr:hypothetical protein FA95DRAFT_1577410 [Auriscalpium vulgare]
MAATEARIYSYDSMENFVEELTSYAAMPTLERPPLDAHFSGIKNDPTRSDVCWQMSLADKGPVDPMDGAAHRFVFTCEDSPNMKPGTAGIYYAKETTGVGQLSARAVLIAVCDALSVKEPMLPSLLILSAAFTPYADALASFLSRIPAPFIYRIEEPEEARAKTVMITAQAEKTKDAGNRAYSQRDRARALAAYGTAASLLAQVLMLGHGPAELMRARRLRAVCLANCAAAYMLTGPGLDQDAGRALGEAQAAEREDAGYIKGYLRQMRAYVALGNVAQARCALERARQWARGADVKVVVDALAELRK